MAKVGLVDDGENDDYDEVDGDDVKRTNTSKTEADSKA